MVGEGRARLSWVKLCMESGGVACGWDTSLWTWGDEEEGTRGRLEAVQVQQSPACMCE